MGVLPDSGYHSTLLQTQKRLLSSLLYGIVDWHKKQLELSWFSQSIYELKITVVIFSSINEIFLRERWQSISKIFSGTIELNS